MSSRQVQPEDSRRASGGTATSRDGLRDSGHPSGSTLDVPSEDDGPRPWILTEKADFFFGVLIAANALVIVLETEERNYTDEVRTAVGWAIIDVLFTLVFAVEMVLRMAAEKQRWMLSPWNLFDAALLCTSLVDIVLYASTGGSNDIRFITMLKILRPLRVVRVLRVLRFLHMFRELWLLVQGIASAVRAVVWGVVLLLFAIFISGLLLTRIVGQELQLLAEDGSNVYEVHFGTLALSCYTLFKFAIEFQGDICEETWDDGPWLTLVLILWTLFANLTILQIISSVIIESIMSIAQKNSDEQDAAEKERELQSAKELMETLFDKLDQDKSGQIDWKEMDTSSESVRKILRHAGVAPQQAQEFFGILDCNGQGTLSRDEFSKGIMRIKLPPDPKDLLKIECKVAGIDARLQTLTAQHEKVNTKMDGMAKNTEKVALALERIAAFLVQSRVPGAAGTGAAGIGADGTTIGDTLGLPSP